MGEYGIVLKNLKNYDAMESMENENKLFNANRLSPGEYESASL